jgi:GH24 family phage-related lysozyme (muramidase)
VNGSDPSGLSFYPGGEVEYPVSDRFVQWVSVEEGTCSTSGHWCQDSASSPWQVGYGHDANNQITPDTGKGAKYVEGLPVPLSTKNQYLLLKWDLEWTESATAAAVPVPLTWNQLYALTDFAYNLGTGYFVERSQELCNGPCSLFDYLTSGGADNAPPSTTESHIIQLFENYNSRGSVARRRYDDAMLYLHGTYTYAPYPGSTNSAGVDGSC